MKFSNTAVTAVFFLAFAGTAPAQTTATKRGPGRIVLTVLDSLGYGPVDRITACTSVGTAFVCGRHATEAEIVIDSLPPGSYRIQMSCFTSRLFDAPLVGAALVQVADSNPVRRAIAVSLAGCDRRPLRRTVGTMSGHWISAFETSSFAQCRPSDWFAPSDSDHTTWFTMSRAADSTWRKTRLPKSGTIVVKDEQGRDVVVQEQSYYFVRVHGTLVGPGHFGHMGAAAFELTADSLIEVATPKPGDCERAPR